MIPALITALLPLVPGIIQGVELAFKTKDNTGPDKMAASVDALRMVVERMVAAQVPLPDGTQIPEKSVSDDLLRGLVETEFQRLRATGKLGAATAATDVFLLRGVVVPVPAI